MLQSSMKRFLDILFSGLALLVLLPFMIPIIVILRFTGEGEIFYSQQRVGKKGKIFGLIKFATMYKGSSKIGTGLLSTQNDPRATPFGKFLRKTKINEIPQLMNILLGDMSIVGPRPLVKEHFEMYPEHVRREIIKVRPGLTGIGSIFFRDEASMIAKSGKDYLRFFKEDIAPYKGELEVWYINNQSLWLDIKLIFLTAWVVFFSSRDFYKKIVSDIPKPPESLTFLYAAK